MFETNQRDTNGRQCINCRTEFSGRSRYYSGDVYHGYYCHGCRGTTDNSGVEGFK